MAKYFVYVIELDPKVADLRKFRIKTLNTSKGVVAFIWAIHKSSRTEA